MLEEYLCLGGTEVANNARAYGYATTSGCPVSWFRCEPCESIHDVTNDWIFPVYRTVEIARNLALNPSFEATSALTVEVRRNLVTNPRGTNFAGAPSPWAMSARWFGSGGAGTTSFVAGASDGPSVVPDSYMRKTWTTMGAANADVSFSLNTTNRVPVVAGQVYTLSIWWRPSFNSVMTINRINAQFYNVSTGGTATVLTGPAFPTPVAGEWQRVSGTFTVPAGMTYMETFHYATFTSGPVVGATLDATGALAELSPVLDGYFDGVTPAAGDFTYVWSGTANLSASLQRGTHVPSTILANNVSLIRSTEWASSGSSSLRMVPNLTGAEGWAVVAGNPGVGMSGQGVDLVAGRTYTVLAKSRLAAPQTVNHPSARRIRVTWNNVVGWTGATQVETAQAPNVAGVTEHRLTFTIAANAVNAGIRLGSGGTAGNGDVWWDDVLIVEGDYGGSYFDGDSVEPSPADLFSWTGTPNASASIWEQEQLESPGRSAEPPYTAANITQAPWYDPDFEPSRRFFGVFIISMENLNSSTRSATVTEGILDGGVVGLVRHTTREVRVRAMLVAEGEDALEYGLAWLTAALDNSDCSMHGSTCGAVDATFFAYCPEGPDPLAPPDNDGSDLWDGEISAPRYLHNVTVISGPLVEQKIKSNNEIHNGYIIEWTMVAATPWVFGTTTEIGISAGAPIVIQDTPFNLMPYPSAELSAGTVVVQTNYSTNPSVETDASGWSASVTTITPAPTGARSTEVAANGVASYKVSVTTTNTGTNGTLRALQTVTLPAESAGQRFSVTEWGFAAVVSGTATLGSLRLVLEWINGASAVLRTDDIGTGLASGGAISAVGLTRPAGSTAVRVYMIADVASWSSGAALNLFADALALTSP